MRKLLFSLLLLGTFALILPSLLSTEWGKMRVEHYLQGHTGGNVKIESLSLSWFGTQTFKGVQWEKEESQISCIADSIICDASLFECLSYKRGTLDLFLNGGYITSASKIKILKREKDLNIRFTPVRATIKEGVISFEHTELNLNDKFQLNMVGTVNLVKNHLDVQLGIPSDTLKKMFKVKELPNGYVLEVPLSCNLNSKALERKLIRIFLSNYARVISSHR